MKLLSDFFNLFYMKTILLIISLIFFCERLAMSQNIEEILAEIKKSKAPDKRTAIFDIQWKVLEYKIILTGEVSNQDFKDEVLNRLKQEFKEQIFDSIEVLPSRKLGDKIYGVVNLSVCNIRSKPEHSAELSTQAIMGTPLKVYKEDSGWYLIQTPDEYLGWVDSDGIELMNQQEMKSWLNHSKLFYKNLYGFIYESEKFSEVVSDIVAGCIVTLKQELKISYQVELPDGRIGFIRKEEAEPFEIWFKKLSFTPEEVIQFGKKMLGFPYLWGGTSIKGVDCSGFMKTIFFYNGLILPRDANQQALVGEEVPFDPEFSEVKPGDLIYFGRKASSTRPERITHVGIYLGNKKFMHSSGRVRIDSFDSKDENFNEYRLNTIVRIKRISNPELLESLKITNNKYYQSEKIQ